MEGRSKEPSGGCKMTFVGVQNFTLEKGTPLGVERIPFGGEEKIPNLG